MTKIGRNASCSCGSGRKFKHCCGAYVQRPTREAMQKSAQNAMRKMEAAEEVRRRQQGLGKPIVTAEVQGHRLIGIGSTLHYSRNWKVFSDFLLDFIKIKLGGQWGYDENQKPAEERHPVMQWFEAFRRHQRKFSSAQTGLSTGPMTGAAACYLGLAYGLYLLEHNAELQSRMIERLKKIGQFQGAYYELMVMSCMIRAGFKDIKLEDETKGDMRRGEFTATYHETGEIIWVEAKARGVPGVLGRTRADGTTRTDPSASLIKQLNDALDKPTAFRRFIFLDVNAAHLSSDGEPAWASLAWKRLLAKAASRKDGQSAYVFVTNLNFHLHLEDPVFPTPILPFGLGIPDFVSVEPLRLSDHHRRRAKHRTAHSVIEAIHAYPHIPETFDGRPYSHAFRTTPPITVGRPVKFNGANDEEVAGVVEQVVVVDGTNSAYVRVHTQSEQVLLPISLSPEELADFRKFGSAYFGDPVERNHHSKNVRDHYDWQVKVHRTIPRENLMKQLEGHPDYARFAALSDEDFVLEYCEMRVAEIYVRGNHNEPGVMVVDHPDDVAASR